MPTPTNCPASGARRTRSLPASFVLFLAAVALASSACGTGAAAPPAPTNTPPPTGTPMPTFTSTPAPEWVTRTVTLDSATRTYRIDTPGVLRCGGSSAPSGHVVLPCHDDLYPLPPDHPVAAEVTIALDAGWVNDPPYSCRSGTRITVGPGITGYQSDGFGSTSTSSGCGFGGPVIYAFWIANGVCYGLTMNGQPPTETFSTRYGAIWQHMLASFVPAPAESGGTTCS